LKTETFLSFCYLLAIG